MPWMKDGQELTMLPPTVRVGDYNVPTASLDGPALEALGYVWEDAPEPTPEEALAAAVEEIEARYERRFAVLRMRLANVLLMDGPGETEARAALAAEWQAAQVAMDDELAALFEGQEE